MINNRLTITIDCWDKYYDARKLLFESIRRNWNDVPYEFVIACNRPIQDEFYRGKVIVCGDDSTDSKRHLEAMKHVHTKYSMLIVEDGLITKKVNTKRIEEVLDYMDERNISFCKLTCDPNKRGKKIKDFENAKWINRKQAYGINYLCGIYRTDYLISLLESGCKDSWEIERMLLDNAAKEKRGYYGDKMIITDNPLNIKFCIEGGKWSYWAAQYIRENGYTFESTRDVWSLQHDFVASIKHAVSCTLPIEYRYFVKRILMKFGMHFATNK